MREPIDVRGCFVDSPTQRKALNTSEDSVVSLDASIKNLIKFTNAGLDLATEYSTKNVAFAQELADFGGMSDSKEDPEVETALAKFSDTLKEIERSRSMMISHMSDVFVDPIERFMKDEVNPVKDVKRRFDQASDNHDTAQSRYLSKRPKDVSIQESAKEVEVARRDFHEKYIDYALRLNELHAKKKFEFMEYVLAMMYTQFAFFHQGYELLRDLEPFMRDLTGKLHDSRTLYQAQAKKAHSRKEESLMKASNLYNPLLAGANAMRDNTAISKSGYLYKRGSGRMVQPWSKRFFSIEGELLVYSTRGKDEEPTVAINLRVCTVKPAENLDRRFCFEVISPMRTFLLQAESDEETFHWIQCLQNAIHAALNGPPGTTTKGLPENFSAREGAAGGGGEGIVGEETRLVNTVKKNEADPAQLLKVRSLPGNDVCAECSAKDAVWATINLGVALCIECSGIHRSLGVHYSKVRSLTLDKWEADSVEVMLRLGNVKVNKIFEATLSEDETKTKRLTPGSNRNTKQAWIHSKYVKKLYVGDGKDFLAGDTPDNAFWKAINHSDLAAALRCLALGANVDHKNEERNSTTPLHQAILASDNVAVEFLFQWGCDVNAVDADGWSPLHHAAVTNNLRLVLHLLKRHAKCDLKDKLGKTPVDVATEHENVEIVTTLRMFQFEQQEEKANAGRPSSYGYSDSLGTAGPLSPRVGATGASAAAPGAGQWVVLPDGRNSLNLPTRADFTGPHAERRSLDISSSPLGGGAGGGDFMGYTTGVAGLAAATAATATRFAANFRMPQFSRLHDMNAFPASPFSSGAGAGSPQPAAAAADDVAGNSSEEEEGTPPVPGDGAEGPDRPERTRESSSTSEIRR